jgi:hypothetical protein
MNENMDPVETMVDRWFVLVLANEGCSGACWFGIIRVLFSSQFKQKVIIAIRAIRKRRVRFRALNMTIFQAIINLKRSI